MATSTESNGFLTLSPPAKETFRIKDKWLLILEIVWLIIQIPPEILLAIYRKFFGQPKSLRGQVALVTGGARGLGWGLALGLSKEGCKIAVVDVNLTAAEATAEEIRQLGGHAKAYYCNVAKTEDIKKLRLAVTKDLGPVDLLVNNAGLIFGGNVEHCSEDEVSGVISVNLLSNFWMVKEFLPDMKKRNAGHIVAIASLASFIGGEGGCAYIASKFGIRGYMECVRDELNNLPNNKIQTTTICPYFINTSAEYVKRWHLRIPPISIEEVVNATIAGIKADEALVCIPAHHYYIILLLKLMPQRIHKKGMRLINIKMKPFSKDEKTQTSVIIEDLAKHNIQSKG